MRRMTTGRPDIAARMPSKSPCWRLRAWPSRRRTVLTAAFSSAVRALAGRDLGLGTGGDVGDEDRAAHDLEAIALAEHVLGAAEADALGAVGAGLSGLFRLVGVGPDLQLADLVGPAEDGLQVLLVLDSGRWTVGMEPAKTSPVEPSRLTQSPSLTVTPLAWHDLVA